MLPEESPFYPFEYNYQEELAVKKTTDNPYLSYLSKTCSFGIQQLDFPILTYLQWVKSTGKYQVIEYISMINHSMEDYQILDKRLKLTHLNDKKSVLLVVDHVELADDIVARPKSIKTVMLFRLRKSPQMDQTCMIADESERKPSIESSQDELISVLHRWGQASQLFPSKLTLHEWVFQSYSAIRCQLYSL